MPRVLLAIGLALCLGQIAAAQDTPEWQVYAGGSYGHGEISPAIPGLSSVNGWGYNVDVEQYVNRSIGGVVEFGDYYRRPTIDLAPFGFPGTREQVRTHFVDLLAGPQVRHNFDGSRRSGARRSASLAALSTSKLDSSRATKSPSRSGRGAASI